MGANFSAEKNLLMSLRIGLSVGAATSHPMTASAEAGGALLLGFVVVTSV
jgi:hypothetical protein